MFKGIRANFINKWIYCYILLMILSSYSVYMVVFPIGPIVQALSLIISAITFIYISHGKIVEKDFLLPLFVSILFISASLLTTTSTFATANIFSRFTLIFFCVSILQRRGFNILEMVYKCLFSLMSFYFCCYIIFDMLTPNTGLSYIYQSIINQDDISTYILFENHYNFYIRWSNNISFFGIDIKRLCGFCWEPGQYQFYLNYVLMYLLFFDETKGKRRLKILFTLLNIIICGSSMGYLIAVAFFIIALMKQKNKYLQVFCSIPLFLIGGYLMISIIEAKRVDAVYSFTNRTSELKLLIDILFNNNILGAENIKENPSNGFIRFLWAYGYLAIAALVGIGICIFKNKNLMKLQREKIVFLLWIVLSLFNEPIEYYNFTILIVSVVILDFTIWKSSRNRQTGVIE